MAVFKIFQWFKIDGEIELYKKTKVFSVLKPKYESTVQ